MQDPLGPATDRVHATRNRTRLPRSPRAWLLIALAAIVVAGGAFAGVYFTLFNGSSAAPLRLSASSSSGSHLSVASAARTWSVAPGSVVCYRVREKLAFLPAKSDAVGRTSDVAGSLSITRNGSGVRITAASFAANVRTLKSDRSQRDSTIHRIGLQSNQYPKAGFTLTQPISLPASALSGKVFHATATGQLTIHGTTRTVTIPITGQARGNEVETVGSITFPFSEFGMQAPSIGGFVSVENHATLEFDLRFQYGASARDAAMLQAIAALKPISSSAGFPGPGGPRPNGGPNSKQFQAFAACMSKHGVTVSGGPPNSSNPKVAAALKACGSLQPRPPAGAGAPPSSTPTS